MLFLPAALRCGEEGDLSPGSSCVCAPLSEPLKGAGRSAAVTVYGSCGLQDRARQLQVASRTGSHAFPRDLRGSHPRDHGGDGETVQIGVATHEGHATQRQGVGKSRPHVLHSDLYFH